MSEREGGSGFGAFLLGISLGAVLGFLFAPEAGEAARGRLSRKLRGLRDLAVDKAGELTDLFDAAAEAGAEEAPPPRAALEQRLTEAKRRHRAGKSGGRALPRSAARGDEEDEPLA
jgi:gas vesicle protein